MPNLDASRLQNPFRGIKRWLDQPLGGAPLRTFRDAPRDERSFALGVEATQAPEHVDPTLLATLTVEVHIRSSWQEERVPDAAYLAVLDQQDAILAAGSNATAELFGDGVTFHLVEWRQGSVIGVFALRLLSGDPPANLVSGIERLLVDLRGIMSLAIGGPAADWSAGTWQPGPALAPAPPAPPERGDAQISKWLLGAGAFLAASLAAIGISDDELVHARLNNAGAFGWAFGILVGATLLAVLWPAWQARADVTRFVMACLTLAVIAVGGGVVWIATMANDSLSHETKPRIDAKITTKGAVTALSGTVTADGIPNKRWLTVRVTGIGAGQEPQQLLVSKAGADPDGKAQFALDVEAGGPRFASLVVEATTTDPKCPEEYEGDDDACPVLSATPACTAPPAKVACTTLTMRPAPARPRLSATWKTGKGGPALVIHARASAVADDQRMLLSVRRASGTKGDDAPGRVYGATWAPDDSGVIDETLEVPVRKTKKKLCVIFRRLPDRIVEQAKRKTVTGQYGPCGNRLRGVSVLVGPPPV